MTSAREVALRCLERIDHEGAYANLVVPAALERSDLEPRDRRFVTDLVYGTTRLRRSCDALIDRFVLSEPEPRIRTLLRLGAYQLHFAGVAPHAAVDATVALAPKRARGFVNAILRNVTRTPMVWHSDADRLSVPDWMLARFERELGPDEARAAIEAMNEAAEATERVDGYVQDTASQWIAAAVPVVHGETVIDVCAAPGGKATALEAAGAFVVAADLQAHRVGLVTANAARLGADSLAAVVADAAAPPFRAGCADHVLLDAPCSGLGTLRRRADARWRITPADIDHLAALQQSMIDECAPLVAPGGTFVYSVCTLTAAESVDHSFPEWLEPIDEPPALGGWRRFGHGWRLLPHDHGTDGMVLLRYRRTR